MLCASREKQREREEEDDGATHAASLRLSGRLLLCWAADVGMENCWATVRAMRTGPSTINGLAFVATVVDLFS